MKKGIDVMKLKNLFAAVLGVLAAGVAAAGDLAVSAYWQDHMVLQRGKPITVWGKDAAGRSVTVSFAGQSANAVTGSDGFWETTFAQPFAVSATAQTLTITDDAGESLTLSDILVGDVFLAAGQSNMDRRLVHDHTYVEPQAVQDFCKDDDGIRFIRIARSSENTNGQENLFDLPPHKAVNDAIKYFGQGYDWAPAVDTNKNFVSSLALNFAHYIRTSNAEKGQDIPIGIIHASSGGTAIRSWLRPEVLTANGFTAEPTDGGYWNNMMAPIKRAKFRAILWYQGCSDAGKTPDEYKQLMDVLVKDRRERWGDNGDLPFYAVQIGTIGYDNGEVQTVGFDKYPTPSMSNNGQNYAFIREAQRLWDVSDTGTHGLAVILDHVRCMDKGDLHPVDKNFVARRLSLFARRDLYGEPNLTTDGPVFSRAVREADGAVRISFKPGTAKGLTSGRLKMANDLTLSRFIKMDDPVKGFAICGSDGVWKEAEATIEGETIVLRAQGLSAPTRFHYGFWSITRTDNFEFGQRLSLYNGEGLPLSPLAPMDVEVASSSAKTADPVFLPGSGLFSPTTSVTLSCATAGATIRYTTDGSEPTATSSAYTDPIVISATTTIKARAFVANKEASDVMVATYTLGTPAAPTADPMWSVSPYDASAWTPLANNILAGKTGTTSGGLAWGIISKDTANLTDGTVPVTPDGSKLVGFCDNASITYTFTTPQTITELRLSTRVDESNGDLATKLKYAGLHLEDVYVKKSGSSDWVALGRPVYQHTSTETTGAMMFALADEGIGHLAENVIGLKIVFLKGEVVWSQVAEIEASGYATDFEPVTPAAGSLVVDTTVSDHCVLQRGVVNKVKGTATPGATVKVTFGGVSATAVAGANGDFVVSFNPGAANATGRGLVVSDTVNTITISDVLVGDVFYLSGQSNVRFEVEAYNKNEALADCDYPNFRMMVMPSENSGRIAETDKDLPCSWIASSSTTCTAMSSFGFFLGRELIKSKNVPIGIVSAAVKGTDIASWLPNGGCDKYMASRCDHIAVKGAIWYQGESDALNYSDRTYPQKLKNLIQYWRTNRGNSNLPVVVVQLPRYRDTYKNCGDTEKINCWGIFRVDQDLAIAEVDNAVCVPTHDYGAEYNIHPSDKHLMGARIALAVRSLMYGDAVAYRCPYPTGAVKSEDGSSVTVSFPSSTVLSFSSDTASESFGAEEDMFSVGGVHIKPTISADGHSLVFSGSFADATSVDYALCGFPQILVRDANGFPMPPFSLALSSGGEDPVDPTDEPTGESDRQWTAEDYDPAAWTPLANNILAGLTATAGGTGVLAYDAKDVTKLTDGKVSATADPTEVTGLCPGAELVWTFAEPQTLEKIRVSSLMNPEGNGKLFAGISVADILVQRSGSSDWVSLGVSFSRSGSATAGGAQYATLSDPVLGYLAVDVTAVKFVQGKVEAFGNYYSEMEAVGRKSSDSPTYPPAMSGFKVRPWGESAEFSGTVVSLGSGATSCDVYLACGADADHLGAPVKIHTGNAGAFHYELEGLSQSTGYAYSLAVSNNAATVASCAVSGEFTTTAEVHPDWSAYKWAVIGDSLTDPTLNPYAGNFYYNFVARDTGIQLVYTNGVGSTGYKNRQNENRCFYQRLLTDPLPSDVDVVTIFGSVNDWGQVRNAADAGSPSDRIEDGKTTLAAYMNKAIDVVQAQAPGAKLILAGSLYYYNVVGEAHARANETLRAVAEARGIPFYDWLTEDPNDPLDFHQIANDPTAEGSFAKRYARDCPSTIIPGETSFGHPSAEYHEAWLSPHFRGILTTAIASVKPVTLGEPVARPLTDYNGNAVSIAFTGDIPDGAEVSAKVTIGGADYAGEIGEGVVTFEVPSDAVTSGNVYAGKITVTVGGVDYTKDVTLEQGSFKVDEEAEWIAESAASFESTGAWSGDKAEVSGGVIAVSNALFTAAKAAPEDAVVTITSTFGFNNASDEDFNSDAQAGVKVVKVGGFNRYAFLTGDGVVTNLTAAAEVAHSVAVKVTIDKNADTVVYEIGGTEFGPFAAVDGKDAVSKVRYTGATEVASLDGSYRVEFLDTNLASVGGQEYATVADALAAGEAGAVQLLWDASWTPAATGDYNIATNGHFLAIGGELAYQVKDNGDGTVTVTVTGGETPDTPVAGSITLSGGEVKVAVANAQSGFWYTLAKTTDLKQSFVVADDAQWVSGEELLAGTGELTIALGDGDTAAFYRVVVSETAPTLK